MKEFLLTILMFSIGLSCKNNEEEINNIEVKQLEKEYLDIPYASQSPAQKLDVFMPEEINVKNPVLIWIHGGGWKSGDKSDFKKTNRIKELRKRGYAVVAINYRLSGEAIFPAQIFDVKAAIRWVKSNATAYQFNPDKIGLWGSSAGGHLVSLAGTSGGVAELEDLKMGNAGYSSKIQAVVDWYGPIDLLQMDEMAMAQGCSSSVHSLANSPESEFMGFQLTIHPDQVNKANPITYITADDPPFLIEHGLADCTVAHAQSQLFYDNLVPVLGEQKVKIKFFENTGHGGELFNKAETDNEVIDFLDLNLK